MRYTSLTGQNRTGAVWSPGPIANSLWVLNDKTGEPVAVKTPRGDVSAAHEFSYALPELIEHWSGVAWAHNNGTQARTRWGWSNDVKSVSGEDYRHAPKLSEKVWRAAVGDQCDQLELVAA